VLVDVRVDAKERPAISDLEPDCYYLQVLRVAYLPLRMLVLKIERSLTDVIFDDEGARALREEDWWFEAEDGGLLKWYVLGRNKFFFSEHTRRETAEK
jgi:autophagy-related protein 5